MIYDVAIIGGGITGTAVLSSLSRYGIKCVLLERELDIAMGTTKANSAIIHAGFAAHTGSLTARFNVRGNELYHDLETELGLDIEWYGSLVVAFCAEEENTLRFLLEQGKANGVPGLRLLNGDEAREMEPQLSSNVKAALFAPTAGVCWPFGAALAFAEDGLANGADIVRGAEVSAAERNADGTFCLTTSKGEFCARYVVNAAGVGAASVSRLFGDDSFEIVPRKGEYLLFDREVSDDLVRGIVFPVPTKVSKGILVCRTVDGNVFVGPNAMELYDGADTSVTVAGQSEIIAGGQRLLEKQLPFGKAITEFAGVRAGIKINAELKEDFLIGWSEVVPGLYQVAGIQSPGLSAAPAIGEYVAEEIYKVLGKDILHEEIQTRVRHDNTAVECNAEQCDIPKALFDRIICRCEKVSEGEIVAAIRRPCGAVTIDGVKRRTRAGMGRCQGGFCGGKVAKILARELGMPLSSIKKDGGHSDFAYREALHEEMPNQVQRYGATAESIEDVEGKENVECIMRNSDSVEYLKFESRNVKLQERGNDNNLEMKVWKKQIVIVGGGPAGLSAAYGAYQSGARDILIIERERETGGVLQQCIHTGFGLHRFKEELTGPGYAERCFDLLKDKDSIEIWEDSTVLEIEADNSLLVASPQRGRCRVKAEAVVLAMGCRERPRGAIRIPGTRPAGVMTAGTAQRLINLEGYLPGRKAVILGSGDIGLIMARRLTLAGCEVKGVFEICSYSNGLARNVHQCLEDFDIPLYLSHTVVDIKGKDRVRSVVIAKVDSAMKPIAGTEFEVECDTLLLSVGLIPENELTREAGIDISLITGGPIVNQYRETSRRSIFAAGNVVQVHDLVDFVSEEAELAGRWAALRIQKKLDAEEKTIGIQSGQGIRTCVPQRLQLPVVETVKLYIRPSRIFGMAKLVVLLGKESLLEKRLRAARPSEMITVELQATALADVHDDIMVVLEDLS